MLFLSVYFVRLSLHLSFFLANKLVHLALVLSCS